MTGAARAGEWSGPVFGDLVAEASGRRPRVSGRGLHTG